MTNAERDYIIRYRQSGKSCAEIARVLGLSANTVKSFCQRNSIVPNMQASLPALSETVCLCCGNKMELLSHRKPKRVAAYARVSMEKDAMLHSLAAQVSYYSERIQRNPEWEYAGVFAEI